MKLSVSLLPGIIFIFFSVTARANHAAGGELVYEWVSDSTYRFYYKFYRDCTGSAAPYYAVNVCYSNSCNSYAGNFPLYEMAYMPDSTVNGAPVSVGCPGYLTKCDAPAATLPGYEEWWYTGIVSLPFKCNSWRFSVTIAQRNYSSNISYQGSLALEATLNNVDAPDNSSPYFSVKPIPYICVSEPFVYSNGVVDTDNDSLSFEMINPHDSYICPGLPFPIPFSAGSPSYNLSTNPLQTNNTFSLNNLTGQMSYTPALQGSHTISMRVKEYRNGILIGTVVRDVQVQVMLCNSVPTTVTPVTATISGATMVNGMVRTCAGEPFSFCFDVKSTTSTAVLVANDNHTSVAPGASVSYSAQGTDSIRGCFSWTAPVTDTGIKSLTISVKDSTCNAPGVAVTRSFVIPLYIAAVTHILRDTGICTGDSIQLSAIGGSSFSWTVLPGGSPVSSLSCTNCKSPFVKPTITTQYVVTTNLNSGCTKNKDTVTITVSNVFPAKPTAGSNSPVCQDDTIKLTASAISGINYLWKGPYGFTAYQQNPTIPKAKMPDSGYYTVRSVLNGCASAVDSVWVQVKPKPSKPVITTAQRVCPDSTIKLMGFAVGTNNWYWGGPVSFSSSVQNPVIANAQASHSGTYYLRTMLNGCFSDTANAQVTVGIPSTPVAGSNSPVCIGSTLQLTSSLVSDPNASYHWTGPNNYLAAAWNPLIPSVTATQAGDYIVRAKAQGGCYSLPDTVTVVVNPQPSAPGVSSVTYCQFAAAVPLTATGQNLKWYTAATGGSGTTIAPTPSTNSVGIFTWYVTQNDNVCESQRTPITVTIKAQPAMPVANNVTYCQNAASVPLTAAGQNLLWYTTPVGGVSTTAAPTPSTATPGTTTYYVSQNDGCESGRKQIVVTVFALPPAPTVSTLASYCQMSPVSPAITSYVNGTGLLWYSTPTGGIGAATAPAVNTAVVGSSIHYISQTVNGCEGPRAALTVNILAKPAPPAITAATYCQYAPAQALVAVGQNVLWYTTPVGGTGTSAAPIPSTLVAGTFNYYVSQTVNGCESDRAVQAMVINAKPAPPAVNNTSYCQFATTFPLAASGQNIKWYLQLVGGTPSSTAPIPDANMPGVVTYYATQQINGCESDKAVILVTVHATPQPPIVTTPVKYCCNIAAVPLSAAGQDLRWYTTATGGFGAISAPTPSTSQVGSFSYYVSQLVNGCESDRVQIEVIVDSVTNAEIVFGKNPICLDDTLDMLHSGALPPSSTFVWNFDGGVLISGNGAGPVKVGWNSAGTKTVSLHVSKNGCAAFDTAKLQVFPLPAAYFDLATGYCMDKALEVFAMIPAHRYEWEFNTAVVVGGGEEKYRLKWETPGEKLVGLVTISTEGCRSLPFYDTVLVHDDPKTSMTILQEQPQYCFGDTIDIAGPDIPGYQYQWQPAEHIISNGRSTVQAIVSKYPIVLNVSDSLGCEARNIRSVNAVPCCEVYLPDAFTPNGDGHNDLFRPLTIGHHNIVAFRITNRYGQVLFEANHFDGGWDGRLSGEPQDLGTYHYYLKYKCAGEEIFEKKGNFILVR